VPPRQDHALNLGGKRVLLVDDERDARELVSEILHRSNADVRAAASVREALQCIAGALPDIVVCDLAMPEEDGYSLIQTLRQLPPDHGGQTPAIALTAYARDEDRLRALTAGFQMHMTKPVEPRQLVEAIAHLTQNAVKINEESQPHAFGAVGKYSSTSESGGDAHISK
jgi:CheY-like chemotaxis protein